MHSFIFFSCLICSALAWPAVRPRHYGVSAAQLTDDLQKKWYSKFDNTTSDVAVPTDPASVYSCVGTTAKDFPTKEAWLDFEEMWNVNEPVIMEVNEGDQYNEDLKSSIEEVSMDSKVDARLILALVMQESTGNMSIHCTETTACGIMQHRGSESFDSSNAKSSIKSMIEAGVYGTPSVPGYLTYFNGSPTELPWLNTDLFRGNPYAAAHVYNVGHLYSSDLTSGGLGSTSGPNKYAHDILSRLQGWNGWAAGCWKSRKCPNLGFEDRQC